LQVQTTVTLSPREQRFILALAHGLKPTRAATAAGFSVSSARLLLRKPHVRAALTDVARNTAAVLASLERREANGLSK
jgi:phage terminase small subunit